MMARRSLLAGAALAIPLARSEAMPEPGRSAVQPFAPGGGSTRARAAVAPKCIAGLVQVAG
jgi:hypothetical protein